MKPIKRNILLNPGPATTTDSVKYAQIVSDICPRERDFQDLLAGVLNDLVRIVHGDQQTYTAVPFAGSGTAAMEATLSSIIPPSGKILLLINGAYGKRMHSIIQVHGIQAATYKVEWGKPIDWKQVDQMIKSDSAIDTIGMVHHETTTGMLNPIAPLVTVSRKFNLTTVVDAISSFAGIPISMIDTPLDFIMSTSNKCIQGMAGLSYVICSREAVMKLKDYPPRTLYFNLYKQFMFLEKTGQMQFTPPVQTIYALKRAIYEYFEEGEIGRWDRYRKNYEILKTGLKQLGFQLFLDESVDESHILLTVYYPEHPNFDFHALHDRLYERGFTIYPGKLNDQPTFRLSILGALEPKDVETFLEVLSDILKDLKVIMPHLPDKYS